MKLSLFFGMALSAVLIVSQARGDQWDKKTILTVSNQPIQIRDTVLEPGQYVLRLLDSQSDRHVVQIFDRYQTHIINTVLAVPANRAWPTGRTEFTFWETPPGTYKAMRTWYYPGDSMGQEFPYPKHLQQIAMVIPPAPAAEPAPEPQPEAANPEPAPAEQPQTVNPEPEQQPTEVAQNTPPATTPDTTTATSEPQTQLPQTSTPYPLIGLGGAAMLGLYGLLRKWKRA